MRAAAKAVKVADTGQRGGIMMEKRYYTVDSLEARLRAYEARYGVSTERLLAAYRAGSHPEGVPGFDAFEWAATSAEMARLCGHRQPQPA
jgi:hypothetical protein